MFVKAFSFSGFWAVRPGNSAAVLGADKTGMSHSDMEGKLLLGHAQQVCGAPGTAGGSFAGQQVRQPIFGPGRPRECALSGAEVGIDLAGDVALQAADDFLLGFPFRCAAFGVGAGSRVGAQAGEHDPP
jgi:hypothetical protein